MRWRYTLAKKPEKRLSEDFSFGLSKKEIIWIIIITIIAAFMSFIPIIPSDDIPKIMSRALVFAGIILVSITAKKIMARFRIIRIEHRMWEFQRWGYYKRSALKKPIPMGLILPFFLAFFSLGYIKPFVFFKFDAENIRELRILKAQGQRRAQRKEQINEEDLGYTAAAGFYGVLGLGLIGLILQSFNLEFGSELAKFSVYYGLWNLIPINNLDGMKLFFGTYFAWIFIAFLHIILLAIVLLSGVA